MLSSSRRPTVPSTPRQSLSRRIIFPSTRRRRFKIASLAILFARFLLRSVEQRLLELEEASPRELLTVLHRHRVSQAFTEMLTMVPLPCERDLEFLPFAIRKRTRLLAVSVLDRLMAPRAKLVASRLVAKKYIREIARPDSATLEMLLRKGSALFDTIPALSLGTLMKASWSVKYYSRGSWVVFPTKGPHWETNPIVILSGTLVTRTLQSPQEGAVFGQNSVLCDCRAVIQSVASEGYKARTDSFVVEIDYRAVRSVCMELCRDRTSVCRSLVTSMALLQIQQHFPLTIAMLRTSPFFSYWSDTDLMPIAVVARPCVAFDGEPLQPPLSLNVTFLSRGRCRVSVGSQTYALTAPSSFGEDCAVFEDRSRSVLVADGVVEYWSVAGMSIVAPLKSLSARLVATERAKAIRVTFLTATMNRSALADMLMQHPILRSLTSASLMELVDALQPVVYKPGDRVVKAGDEKHLLLLRTGRLSRVVQQEGRDHEAEQCNAPALFGEGFLESGKWYAAYAASRFTDGWMLDRRDALRVIRFSQSVAVSTASPRSGRVALSPQKLKRGSQSSGQVIPTPGHVVDTVPALRSSVRAVERKKAHVAREAEERARETQIRKELEQRRKRYAPSLENYRRGTITEHEALGAVSKLPTGIHDTLRQFAAAAAPSEYPMHPVVVPHPPSRRGSMSAREDVSFLSSTGRSRRMGSIDGEVHTVAGRDALKRILRHHRQRVFSLRASAKDSLKEATSPRRHPFSSLAGRRDPVPQVSRADELFVVTRNHQRLEIRSVKSPYVMTSFLSAHGMSDL